MSAHCSSDFCSVVYSSTRLSFHFCYRLVRLCTVFGGMTVDVLHAFEELVVEFYKSVESVDVVGCFKHRYLLRCLDPLCRCM